MGDLKLRPSRRSFIKNYILGVLLLLIITAYDIVFKLPDEIYLFLLFLVALFFIEPEVERAMLEYRITKNEVVEIKGLVAKRRSYIPYKEISQITIGKGILGRLLNFGNIKVVSAAGMESSITIRGVSDPERYFKLIKKKVEKS